jgi:hypothetical protein
VGRDSEPRRAKGMRLTALGVLQGGWRRFGPGCQRRPRPPRRAIPAAAKRRPTVAQRRSPGYRDPFKSFEPRGATWAGGPPPMDVGQMAGLHGEWRPVGARTHLASLPRAPPWADVGVPFAPRRNEATGGRLAPASRPASAAWTRRLSGGRPSAAWTRRLSGGRRAPRGRGG